MKWQVADCLGTFYRPNFETQIYPYCPTHIERPKETKKLFLVNLPEKAFLTVRSHVAYLVARIEIPLDPCSVDGTHAQHH